MGHEEKRFVIYAKLIFKMFSILFKNETLFIETFESVGWLKWHLKLEDSSEN